MPESLQTLLQELLNNSEFLATALVFIAATLILLVIFRTRIKTWKQARNTRRIIKRLGLHAISHLHLPDGTGGEVMIEHLLLGHNSVIVVSVMRFDGLIFGGPQTNQWTQVINRRSYKFDNPDQYLQRQINAIRQIAPGIEIEGRHLFTGGAKFPRDKPDNVLQYSDFKKLPKRPRTGGIPKQLRSAWKHIVETTGK